MQSSEARERVLHAAEALFAERGYTAVTIKDIAAAAGIHHASLYHHAPKGKEQLYVEVTERILHRHAEGLAQAIASGHDLRAQLRGIASWLLAHPPMDLIRMVNSDVPSIAPSAAGHLFMLAYQAMLLPVEGALEAAHARGEIGQVDFGTIGGALISSIEGLHALPGEYAVVPKEHMAWAIIEVFLAGMRPA